MDFPGETLLVLKKEKEKSGNPVNFQQGTSINTL
jgi:hypothetical protein